MNKLSILVRVLIPKTLKVLNKTIQIINIKILMGFIDAVRSRSFREKKSVLVLTKEVTDSCSVKKLL